MGVLGYEPMESQLAEDEPATGRGRAPDYGVVDSVEPGSLAERAGFMPGDRILVVNDEPIRDAIDLVFHASESELTIRYQRERAGEPGAWQTFRRTFEREPGEELGLVLKDFKIKMCNNQCIFCFIHQNPEGLRKGIYFKDGDYRMSFLHGNYITTTNMKEDDFQRIVEQHLSPMYVSVHTTNHDLRLRMLGVRKSNNVLENLKYLRKGGIEFHTQIVLCPGWNDGAELDRTLRELSKLRPALLSIAIVPLGMTEHREHLPKMEPVTPSFCKRVIAQVEAWQSKLMEKYGEPVVYLADEFYITAGLPAPDYRGLDVLHQLENGVGMVWQFMAPWRGYTRKLPKSLPKPKKVAILTGILGTRVLEPVVRRLNQIEGLTCDVIPCFNSLFGRSITVSGLLSGRDFLKGISENPGYDKYILPGNAVRHEGNCFLDDMTMETLNRSARGRAIALEGNSKELAEAILS